MRFDLRLLVFGDKGLLRKYHLFRRVFAKIREVVAKYKQAITEEIAGLHFRELSHTGATRMYETSVPTAQVAVVR